MHRHDLTAWRHDHVFGQDETAAGERATRLVVRLTLAMMGVEIVAGTAYGSMALLADGVHMASHAAALGIGWLAYVAARRYARDPRFSFGTGKVNALAGFSSALLLAVFALGMAIKSVERFLSPVPIRFDQAIAVAAAGLLVNVVCAILLRDRRTGSEDGHERAHGAHPRDLNLRGAYLHVLADAATSILAIVALLAGRSAGLLWLDPAMGIAGAALVSRWSFGLLRSSASVLLDRQVPEALAAEIRTRLEEDGDARVADLHAWTIGPGVRAATITLVAETPLPPDAYKRRLPESASLRHVTVEIRSCREAGPRGPLC